MRSEEAKHEIENFAQIHGAPVAVVNQRLTPVEAKGVRAKKLQAKAIEVEEMMRSIGVRPATIINIRPMEVRAQGTHASNYPVAACAIGKRFEKTVIPTYEIAISANEHGEEEVKPILPITIAEDIRGQMQKNGYRGVLVFLGNIDPDRKLDPRDSEMRDVLAEIQAEKLLMVQEFEGLVAQAENEAARSDGSGRKNITDVHRMAARYLLHERRLSKQPAWLLDTRRTEDIPELCPNCKAEPAKGSLQCRACFAWLKPVEAYRTGYLTLEDPNGRLALQRLSKAELLELKLYPTIRPVAEVNAEWLKKQGQ